MWYYNISSREHPKNTIHDITIIFKEDNIMDNTMEKFVNFMDRLEKLYDRGLCCEYEMLQIKIREIEKLKAEYTAQLEYILLRDRINLEVENMVQNIK
jgi:hypothetical protein